MFVNHLINYYISKGKILYIFYVDARRDQVK